MSDPRIQITQPTVLGLVNNIGAIAKSVGLGGLRLDARRIVEHAEAETGAELLDPIVREGLDVLVQSLDSEANLNLFGSFAVRNILRRGLTSRLQVEEALVRDTPILEQKIQSPVFIVGMPRSGTTILHALLQLDRNHRAPLCWECLLPYPAPTKQDYTTNERIDRIGKDFEQIFRLVPDFKAKHYMAADSPQECVGITALNFVSFQFLAMAYIPSYHDWFMRANQVQNLRWHRRFLQYLQSGGISAMRWLLKSPVHLMRFPAIFDVYPDAKVIVTHRHPEKVIPSVASLISSMRSLYTSDEDSHRTGQEQLAIWSDYLKRFLSARTQLGRENQIVDVQFEDFRSDQLRVIDSIYARFGWNLHADDRKKMRHFLDEEQQGKHGAHEYSLSQFGLDSEMIAARFNDYIDFSRSLNNRSNVEHTGR